MGVANPEMAGLTQRPPWMSCNEARAPCALMAFASLESPLILLSSAALMPRMKAVPRGSTAVPSMLTKPTPPLARSA